MDDELKTQIETWCRRIESEGIPRWVPAADEPPGRLHAAMRYSLEAGGKRVRPVLLLAVGDLFGAVDRAIPAAVAVECIHTYSLIHDDLPSMDNSDLRRGRPSCHKAFDEPTAVLAGDALLTLAFEILGEAYGEDPAVGMRLVRLLGEAAGSRKLVGGQMADIEGETAGVAMDADSLAFIHTRKTAALLTAALRMGGVVGGADSMVDGLLESLGQDVGLGFQIVDDILDVTSSSEILGKTVARDADNAKTTYVDLYGIDGARSEVAALTLRALETVRHLPGDTTFIEGFVRWLESRIA